MKAFVRQVRKVATNKTMTWRDITAGSKKKIYQVRSMEENKRFRYGMRFNIEKEFNISKEGTTAARNEALL
jgi:hypothetical protein